MTIKNRKFNKFVSLTCVFAMVLVCFGYANYTNSYFVDIERSDNNEYSASILDLELDIKNNFETDIFPGETKEKEISAINSGSLPFYYYILVDIYEANNPFCNSLQLNLNRNGVDIYNGLLVNFNVSNIYLANATSDNLVFSLSLPGGAGYFSNTCEFNFLFTAQQGEFAGTNLGFDDDEIADNSITGAGQAIVLNEILPNPEGFDNQERLLGEWVELYNNSNSVIDLAGWYIEDDSADGNRQTISNSNTLFNSTVIGPQGSGQEWLVLFMTGDILGNAMDTVSLYDNYNNLVDEYSYSLTVNNDGVDPEETPGDTNTTIPGDVAVDNEGKSDARIPDGYGDWVDPVPTPGGINNIDLYDREAIIELTDVSNPIAQTTPVETIVPMTVDDEPLAEAPEEDPVATSQDASSTEETITEDPVVVQEITEPPYAEASEGEESVVQEPIEEPLIEEDSVEEPVVQESVEPLTEEPVTQEPTEPLSEDPVETSQGESLPAEEPLVEEDLPIEEPVAQEAVEEPVIEESTEELPSLESEVENTNLINEDLIEETINE